MTNPWGTRPEDAGEGLSRRCLLAYDIEGYSRRVIRDQVEAQRVARQALDEAIRTAGFPRHSVARQPAGDGEFVVLPEGVPDVAVLSRLVPALAQHLREYNRTRRSDVRVRVRLAIHAGLIHAGGALGYPGDAANHVARLLDGQAVRGLLRQRPDISVAVIVSADTYRDVVAQDYPGIRKDLFRRTRVTSRSKNFQADAWIYTPEPPSIGHRAAGRIRLAWRHAAYAADGGRRRAAIVVAGAVVLAAVAAVIVVLPRSRSNPQAAPTSSAAPPTPIQTPTQTRTPSPTVSIRPSGTKSLGHIDSPAPDAGVKNCAYFAGTSQLPPATTLILVKRNLSNGSSARFAETVFGWAEPEKLDHWQGAQYFGEGNDSVGQTYQIELVAVPFDATLQAKTSGDDGRVHELADIGRTLHSVRVLRVRGQEPNDCPGP
jgi:hypothetical protein